MEAKNKNSRKPRLVGGIVKEMLQGWHRNTELSVDLKTILRSDERLQTGKDYHGLLRRDVVSEEFRCDEHFIFVETLPWSRNATRDSSTGGTSRSPVRTTARSDRTSSR